MFIITASISVPAVENESSSCHKMSERKDELEKKDGKSKDLEDRRLARLKSLHSTLSLSL